MANICLKSVHVKQNANENIYDSAKKSLITVGSIIGNKIMVFQKDLCGYIDWHLM